MREDYVEIVVANGYKRLLCRAFYRKWRNLKNNVVHRNVECLLSFKQYVRLARKAGIDHPDQIGNYRGDYQMARYGDTGNYVLGNCRFITKEENLKELVENGGHARGRLTVGPKISRKLTGLTKENSSWRARAAMSLSGRSASTHDHVAISADAKAKNFVATSPSGKQVRSRNVSAFCREHGLQQANFSRVLAGDRLQHKGWTGKYVK